jgi:hypothetical protein
VKKCLDKFSGTRMTLPAKQMKMSAEWIWDLCFTNIVYNYTCTFSSLTSVFTMQYEWKDRMFYDKDMRITERFLEEPHTAPDVLVVSSIMHDIRDRILVALRSPYRLHSVAYGDASTWYAMHLDNYRLEEARVWILNQ